MDKLGIEAMNQDTLDDADLENFEDPYEEDSEEAVEKPAAPAPAPTAENDAPATSDVPQDTQQDAPRDNSGLIARHRYNYQKQQRDLAEHRAAEYERRALELEQKLQELAASQHPTQTTELEQRINDYDIKIEEARLDGDSATAAKLRAEQRQIERQMIEQTFSRNDNPTRHERQIIQRAADSLRLESTIERLEQAYPMLEEGNEAFDGELSEEVMTLFDSLAGKYPAHRAMEQAVTYVTRAHGISTSGGQAPRGTNVPRNVRAAASQPPELSRAGLDADRAGVTRKVDVMKMSQDDFERLDDATIEKMLLGIE